jgi:hypothetical protein
VPHQAAQCEKKARDSGDTYAYLSTVANPETMKHFVYLILALGALATTACSVDQVDGALDDGLEGSIVAGDKKEENNLDIQRAVKPRWKPVANFNGKQSKKTSTFKVTGETWKVEWDVKGGSEEEFIIIMKNRHDREDSEIIANQIGSGADFVDFEGGQGEYYLDISSKVPYTIKIEEYK